MRVIYYSYAFFADCDFPFIKALQSKGIDVHYYMPLPQHFQRSSILEFNRPIDKMMFVKASRIKEMQVYKECLDLDRLYFIMGFRPHKYWIPSWCLWLFTLWHMKRLKADIIHIDWQFGNYIFEKMLFSFKLASQKVMTVHDPIMHSGQPNASYEEMMRIRTFRWSNHYILLNKIQKTEFIRMYSIPESVISNNVLPSYTSISKIRPIPSEVEGDYILFFGQIIPYKGLEFLLEAMIKVHNVCPDLKLVIAGGGKLYFDISKYVNLDFIIWRHRYIGIRELAGLLLDSKFTVCPYKDATQSGVVQTAFAMGVPVVASNVGAMSVAIKDKINGLLVPPCDVEALAEAIINLNRDTILLQSMKNCISKFNQHDKSPNEVADKYIQIYRKVLMKKSC